MSDILKDRKPKLIGETYMRKATENSREYRFGRFECSYCGNTFECRISSVNSGDTKSCGCIRGKSIITHCLRYHNFYGTWRQMVQRCNNPKRKAYKYYGLRRITVCNEWLDINNFINDMYPSYKEGLTIDRIDSNGNYEKANCRWASREIQQRNKRLIQVNNTSGYKGACLHKPSSKFTSSIRVNRKLIYLGCYNTAIEAAKKI